MEFLKNIERAVFPCTAKLEKVLKTKEVQSELKDRFDRNKHKLSEALLAPKRI